MDAAMVLRARTRRYEVEHGSFPFGLSLEVAISVGVITVLIGLCASTHPLAAVRARLAEGLQLTHAVRLEATVDHALTGQWHARSPPDIDLVHVEQPTFAPAGVSFALTEPALLNDQRRVAVQAAERADEPSGAPVIWLCGSSRPPAGYQRVGDAATTLPPAYLPSSCSGNY